MNRILRSLHSENLRSVCLRSVSLGLAFAISVAVLSRPAFAGDEFHGVVRAIEDHYGVRHMHIPMLGFALWFARVEGVSGVKLAILENPYPRDQARGDEQMGEAIQIDEVRDVVERGIGDGWHRFVETHSRNGGENTLVYTNLTSGKMQIIVVSLEGSETVVVQMNLSDRAIARWMREPGEEAAKVVHSRSGEN